MLIRTEIGLRGFQKRTITKRIIDVPVVNLAICTLWLCGMTFAKHQMQQMALMEVGYEEVPRLHIGIELIGSYRNARVGRWKNTRAE